MEDLATRINNTVEKLNLDEKRKRIRLLTVESERPSFWQDHQRAGEKMKEISSLQKEIEEVELLELYFEEGELSEAEKLLHKIELLLYFSGTHDRSSAILSIHSGQGGTEAMDWAEMLYRMYTRYFEKKGWKVELLDQTLGEEAGIKSVTMSVEGKYAYGFLKWEGGAHRLVRQSPFNADKLRQTSFSLVEVMPQVEDAEVDVKEDELEWEFYRSGGHGGQNVNKVSTAVRLKHLPSGIVVTCQTERFQGANRESALKLLKSKLWNIQEEKRKEEEARMKGGYKTPGWGNQIRSYVLHPYKMVKDLRTDFETSNTESVLDGELDGFIEAELRVLS